MVTKQEDGTLKWLEYIFTERNGIYIIDLQKTVKKLGRSLYASFVIFQQRANQSLFVGTKETSSRFC